VAAATPAMPEPALARIADAVTRAALVLILLSLLGVVVLGVAMRALNAPLSWTDEAARYLMVWLALLGWILAARRRAHVRVTVLLDRLPARVRRGAELLIQLAVALFGLGLVWHGAVLVERNWDLDTVSLPVPAGVLYLPLLPAGAALALQALAEARAAWRAGA
jgi:TRAP-type C4-dicarboxylate transport system permease small subunit